MDYERILREAEKEADVVVWDGGNNDTPFFKPGDAAGRCGKLPPAAAPAPASGSQTRKNLRRALQRGRE